MFDDDEDPPQEFDLVPEVRDSSPEIPDPAADLPDPSEAPRELARAFVKLVVVFNLALFAIALGLMLIGFEGRLRDGGAITAVGVAAFVYGLWGYRNRPRVD